MTILYVVDLSDVDEQFVSEIFETTYFGRTTIDRNITILSRKFGSVRMLIIVENDSTRSLLASRCTHLGVPCEILTKSGMSVESPTSINFNIRSVTNLALQRGVVLLEKAVQEAAGLSTPNSLLRPPGDSIAFPLLANAIDNVAALRPNTFRIDSITHVGPVPGEAPEAILISTAAFDVTQFPIERPGTESGLREILLRSAQTRSFDGPFSRLVTRRLSIRLSPQLSEWGASPNAITATAGCLEALAVMLFASGPYLALLAGALLWLLADVLDEVDGEVARLRQVESEAGGWLDLLLDRVFDAAALVGLAWPLLRENFSPEAVLLLIAAISIVLISSYTGLLYDSWNKRNANKENYFRIGRDIRNATIVVGAIVSLRIEILLIVSCLAIFEIVRRICIVANDDSKKRTISY